MFANPDPDDFDDDDDGFSFGPYDIKNLIGTTLIAWAFSTSVGLAIYLS